MYIVFLKFGPQRDSARQWMTEHLRWIQQGIDEGAFLLAGSLDQAQGGVVLAAGQERAQLQARVEQDPFVVHGVVCAEVIAVAPSRMAPRMEALLDSTGVRTPTL